MTNDRKYTIRNILANTDNKTNIIVYSGEQIIATKYFRNKMELIEWFKKSDTTDILDIYCENCLYHDGALVIRI